MNEQVNLLNQEHEEVLKSSMNESLLTTGEYKVIYVFSVPNSSDHVGRLKVGDATLHTKKRIKDITQSEIDAAARARIDSYAGIMDTVYELEHSELAVRPSLDGEAKHENFRDYEVHEVLMRSGIKKEFARKDKKNGEWFTTDVNTVKRAIKAVINREFYFDANDNYSEIILRDEQNDAVNQTKKVFRNGSLERPKRMLWNAKMRFGKTLTAYSLVKELNETENVKKVLILTHRPVVNDAWWEDFRKLNLSKTGWVYGSKHNKMNWSNVESSEKFFWFASIQDLRGSFNETHNDSSNESDLVGLNVDSENTVNVSDSFDDSENDSLDVDIEENVNAVNVMLSKNKELFNTEFDLVITDEAHEGSLTELAKQMFKNIKSRYFLDLSGTPFNLLAVEDWEDSELHERFSYDDQFNWSYPDERKAKEQWDKNFPGDPNPYSDLPEIRFITYDIKDTIASLNVNDTESTKIDYSFTELFKVKYINNDNTAEINDTGNNQVGTTPVFVHEEQVMALLRKMKGDPKYSDNPELFPFHEKHGTNFAHTLWMLPNVPAVIAMKNLLERSSSPFRGYHVVNATGEGSKDWNEHDNALQAVTHAVKTYSDTITLSQGMLTTGVSVPEWTAVFMLNNTSSPMLYMQTAFRGTTAGSLPDGRMKTAAYVFDFNPNRCLNQIVEIAKKNAPNADDPKENPGNESQDTLDRREIDEYLSYISLLTVEGSQFVKPDSTEIMNSLHEAYIDEIVFNGFDSPRLWNNKELIRLDIKRAKIIEALRIMQGGTKKSSMVIGPGMTSEEKEKLKELHQKQLKEKQEKTNSLSSEEKQQLRELKKKEKQDAKNRKNAVNVLAGIASRMPLLVYASSSNQEFTPENFASLIDDESWTEFMPKNLRRIKPSNVPGLEERLETSLEDMGGVLYWDDVKNFFDSTMFRSAAERVRLLSIEADSKPPLERVIHTAALFSYFQNPDKETVLTPARVVQMQYVSTLGGLQLFDLQKSTALDTYVLMKNIETNERESISLKRAINLLDSETHVLAPRWRTRTNIDKTFWSSKDTTIIDLNSKTALYPLWAAASLYWVAKTEREQTLKMLDPRSRETVERNLSLSGDPDKQLWNNIIENQVFVNCRVPYSKLIAERVLRGHDQTVKTNITVVGIIKLRKHLADLGLFDKVSKQRSRENDNQYAARVEQWNKTHDSSKVFKAIFNVERMNNKLSITSEELVDKIMSMDKLEDVMELTEIINAEDFTKFDAAVGNPPYSKTSNSIGGMGSPVYQGFFFIGKDISHKISLIHPAKFIYGAGGDVDLSRMKDIFINDKRLKILFIEENVTNIFNEIDMTGGLCYYLWDDNKKLSVETKVFINNSETSIERNDLGIFVSSPIAASIISKIDLEKGTVDTIYGDGFGLPTYLRERPHEFGLPEKLNLADDKTKYRLHDTDGKGIFSKKHKIFELPEDWTPNKKDSYIEYRDKWCVHTPVKFGRMDTPGELKQVIGALHRGKPGDVCTGSYVTIGSFTNEKEMENFISYVKTRFFRFMLNLAKGTPTIAKKFFILVPLQDFTDNSDINWSQSIKEIEKNLYKKYDFTKDEIAYIESIISEID